MPKPTARTVEVGTPVFIIGFTTDSSSVEISTSGGAAQLMCAVKADRSVQTILLAVDGGPEVDIGTPRFDPWSRQHRSYSRRQPLRRSAGGQVDGCLEAASAVGWLSAGKGVLWVFG